MSETDLDLNEELSIGDTQEETKVNLETDLNLSSANSPTGQGLSSIRGFSVEVSAEVGTAKISLHEAEQLTTGSVVMLDKMEGELADVKINGALIGKGQIVEENGRFGVKITSINNK